MTSDFYYHALPCALVCCPFSDLAQLSDEKEVYKTTAKLLHQI